MVIKGLFQSNPVKSEHDEYYTKRSAWEDIQDFIPRNKRIWEAFMLDGLSPSAQYLTELGFDVEWGKEDFFEEEKREDTILVSNCPFSLKKEVLQRVKFIDQPFILLLPSTVLHTKYFLETFGNDKRIQLIVPATKRHFSKYVDGEFVETGNNCSFYTLYICWQIGLEHDLNFIK
jgi:hypothetical protein